MTALSADKKALLAQRLRRRDGTVTISPRPPGTAAPLSPAQERIWFLEQYAPGTTVYTVPLTVRVAGDLDAAALEHSLHEVVRRHEALRMRFRTTPDGLPEVLIDEEARTEFLTADAAGPDEARELVERELTRTFDLTAGPLVRALLVRIAPGDHVLMLAAHHLVTDGWSFEIIMRELFEIMDGRTPPPPAVQYGDYAAWQRDRRHEREVAHWRDRLAGVPVLDLPTDRPRPPVLGHTGATHRFELDVDLAGPAQSAGATPYMVVLAAFQALLGRYSGQTDFAIGSPIAGRGLPELDGVVGMFVNTLAMRADLDGDPTFAELLARVRDRALDAYAHQDLPFDRLVTELNVERDVSRSPVVQVMLALQNFTATTTATGPSGGAALSAFPVEAGIARFDLSLYLFERPGGLSGQLTYNTALFDPGTAARMATHFGMVLRAALADPSLRLSELPLLAEGERERVLAFSRSPAPAPLGRELLHDLVAGPPDTVAVTCDGRSLTYADLAGRSDSLARRLQGLGVTRGSRVGIRLERSSDLAVAVLAVLKAGGAYVPLDPAQPEDRLAYMLADAGVRVTVTEDLLAGLPSGDVPADPGLTGADLAYVIYTSGTTGRPKGVAVQHRQVLAYLAGVRDRLAVEPGGSYALMQSLSFDFGVTIFYLSLMTGGTLHLLDPRRPAAELAETLSRTDYLKATPSHLASLIAEAGPDGPGVLPRKLLVLGGEASASAWAGSLRGPRVVNHYGPTEATVGVTTHEVTGTEETQTLPIGRPLPGARAYVLDERGEPAPIGVIGEIHLGGDRLARGYLGRPALTAERFLPDPYGEPGSRMYRTGDLGRWLPSGDLQFLGRRDLQVKVRGYRVELTEIEEVLTGHPAVEQAVVDLRRDRLVAYLTGERAGVADVRAYLADRLPEYMIPARYVWLDRLPLKAHGKVDRAALPEPGADRTDEDGGYVPPETALETAIAEVWAGVLELDRVGAEDDFFELGGHSLLAAQVVARLRGVTERPVTIMDLFRHRTVRALTARATAPDDGPRKLLNRLTPARAVSAGLVCVPYGGGSAAIYQPLADALPPDWALHSVAVPGQEWGLDEETRPVAEVADACVREILADVPGPLSLYGHCGLGVMLCVEIARRLEAAGRPVDALYLGGGFPFARPKTIMTPLRDLADRLRSDRVWANALVAAGLDIDELDPDQLAAIIRNRRQGTRDAEAYFTRLFAESPEPLRAPIISVVGDRDPATEFYQERYLEWHHLTGETAVVVLDEAGHFFVKHRAGELAEIVTGTRAAIAAGRTAEIEDRDRSWWLHATSTAGTDTPVTPRGPRPSMKRFGAVAAGQLVSIIGSSLTEFAIPLWIYLTTGSLVNFALFSVIALVPGMLVAPLAGAIVDRYDRRKVMLAGDAAAGGTQLVFGLLLWTGHIQMWHVYPLLALLSVALTFQRLAYGAAVPQLVPKRYLGHANGILQVVTGTAQLIVPLVAVGLMSAIGIRGILVIDVASYAFALCSVLLVRFPAAMGWKRRESLVREMAEGFRYSWGQRGFRGMLLFFACLNVFLSPLFLLLTPLVLGFATLSDVGRVSFAGGLGVLLGGLTMTVWGGPRRLRMRGVLLATLVLAAFCLVTGLRESLVVIAVGAFGMSLALTLVNGVYATIIQVKVPQRFHGRVIALNTLVAWSTLPIGFGLVAPYGTALFEPLLAPDGPLASTVGQVVGVGEGRGVAFMYVVFALAIAAIALVALKIRVLARFDHDVPDAPPDDVIGLEAVRRRTAVH